MFPKKLIDFCARRTGQRDIGGLRDFAFEPTEIPDATIVIPVHNQLEYTVRCLRSLSQHRQRTSFEVIVVDDASGLAEFQTLSEISGIRVVRNFKNLGFVRGCNRGARFAKGRYLVFLNNDTEVTPGWLDALAELFDSRPDAGLVGAKLLYPDGSLQEAGGICWRDGSAWNFGRNRDPSLPQYNYVRETDYCSGAAIAIRTDLWRQLHGFDEIFAPAYYEDTDLAFRVRAAGRRVYFQPASVVVHHEGKSNGTDESAGIKRYQVRNREVFFKRWEKVLSEHRPNAVDVFRARERSLSRKTILFIDHYVPHPDRDAGSRSIMSYLRFFLGEGFSVKFIGDNFAEMQPYTRNLQQMGVEVLCGPHMAAHWEQWLQENGRHLDYVFLSRAHTSQRWLAPLRQSTKAPLLFYGQDLLSRTLARAYEQFGDPQHKLEAEQYDACEQAVFPRVDWIYYPSQDEVDSLRSHHPGLRVARLPLLTFAPPDREAPSFGERRGLLFVGGFGHPPNLDALMWFIRGPWLELLRTDPSLTLTVVGSNPPAEVLGLQSRQVSVRKNVSDAELAALYRAHRVSIVPLRIGGGIKGKILESMHFGTPVVTTGIGAEGLSWSGEHLALATGSDFSEKVLSVYRDSTYWTRLQFEAWRFLAAEYSTERLRSALAPAIPELRSVTTSRS